MALCRKGDGRSDGRAGLPAATVGALGPIWSQLLSANGRGWGNKGTKTIVKGTKTIVHRDNCFWSLYQTLLRSCSAQYPGASSRGRRCGIVWCKVPASCLCHFAEEEGIPLQFEPRISTVFERITMCIFAKWDRQEAGTLHVV